MLRRFKISGHSMSPTLKDGWHVITEKITYLFRAPKIGDIITFKSKISDKVLIKRIVGIGRSGKIKVAGDNPADSLDSRIFGLVDRTDIIGRLIVL